MLIVQQKSNSANIFMVIKQIAILPSLTLVSALIGNHCKSFSCFSLDIVLCLVLNNTTFFFS